ncbi:MAG: hypothetical protein ABR560_07490 [Bacteroidales bacterium]
MAIVIMLSLSSLVAQDGTVRPSKSEAQAAWESGDYTLAYEHYNGLLLLYSRDPLYKYFTGACLVKMERDIPRAVTLLGSAINSSVNIKSVPDDVWFYYGRALQLNGSFIQAGDAYDSFARAAGRRLAAEYDVQSYIDQCSRGQGALSPGAVTVTVTAQPRPPQETDRLQVPAAPAKPSPTDAVSKQQAPVVSDLPAEYETVLAEAVRLQHEADSITQTNGDTDRAVTLQSRADSLFKTLEDPADAVSEETVTEEIVTEETEEPLPAHHFSEFEVLSSPAYSERNPVPLNFAMPPGLVYTVQIAAFRNAVAPSLFKGLYPVFGGRRAGSDVTYYYTGLFRRLEDALQALPGARGAGFPDAFVVAMMDGTQVSMERARLLEMEWSAKPLPGKQPVIAAGGEPRADPAAPVGTLSFRAEVMRASKPIKSEVIEKLELLAGTRGLAMIKNNDGETVFLIGNFITFESAEEYVSLMIRNGYSTARVAAYVGMHEIPVEAAKELLMRLQDD